MTGLCTGLFVKTTYATFDIAEYLDNDEAIAEYLSVAAANKNPDVFIAAIGDVAKAKHSLDMEWKDSCIG